MCIVYIENFERRSSLYVVRVHDGSMHIYIYIEWFIFWGFIK